MSIALLTEGFLAPAPRANPAGCLQGLGHLCALQVAAQQPVGQVFGRAVGGGGPAAPWESPPEVPTPLEQWSYDPDQAAAYTFAPRRAFRLAADLALGMGKKGKIRS